MRNPRDCRCSYVVLLDQPASNLRDLARYLSDLGMAGCEVLVLDRSPRAEFKENARVLRWVSRHLMMPAGAPIDPARAASAVAACDTVIVATDDVRYTPEAIVRLCTLLDAHEVVEPQDYLDPLPWWGSIDAARILLHRAIEPQPDHGATFAFRSSAMRSLRALTIPDPPDDPVRRLAAQGAEVHTAGDVFVRREPRAFPDWLAQRPRVAGEDFVLPIKTAFFLSIVPLLLLLAILGGLQLASGYAGAIAFASVALAIRGRAGAASFFPLRACAFAPLWIFERSVSVYWALFRKLRDLDTDSHRLRPELREPRDPIRDAIKLDDVAP